MDYMGARERFKRILSVFLSLAMAVTLLPAQMAYAEANSSEAGINTLSNEMGLPAELAHFTFDSENEIAGKIVGSADKAQIVSSDDGHDSTPYLNLKGGSFIRALDGSVLAGKKELTISYWSKTGGSPGWAFYAAKDNLAEPSDNYIGILDQTTYIKLERYLDGRVDGVTNKDVGSLASGWRHVSVVFGEDTTEVYVNGERKISMPAKQAPLSEILTEKSVLKIGTANWGRGAIASEAEDAAGEVYKGAIDDFAVYDGALDAAQVKYLYDGTKNDNDTSESLTGLELKRNTCTMSVGGSLDVMSLLKVPEGAGSRIEIQSSDSTVVADAGAGIIKALKAGTATLTLKWGYGAKSYTVGTVAVTVGEFAPVSSYGFEGSLDGATAIQTKLAAYSGSPEYAENGHRGKALQLKAPTFKKNDKNEDVVDDAGYGIKLKEGKLGADYTVSLWVNAEKGFHQNSPIMALGVGTDSYQNWIAASGNWVAHPGVGTKARAWGVGKEYNTKNTDFNANYNKYTNTEFEVKNGNWVMLTMSQCGNDLKFYVNGQPNGSAVVDEVLNQDNAAICIGINNWDPSFKGMIDDVNVYNSALDAAQVRALYLSSLSADEAAEWLEIKDENKTLNCVTKDLNLPAAKDGVNIQWTAKEGENASAVVKNDGTVTAGGGNKVTLTAACTDTQTGMTWTTEIPIKVARKVIIRCLDEEVNAGADNADLIETVERMEEEGSEYVHTPEEIVITDKGAYKYEAKGTKNTKDLKITVGAGADGTVTDTVNVAYKKVSIKSVVTPDDAYVIEGNELRLPEKLGAVADAGNGEDINVNAPVKWTDDYANLKARKEPYIINGTVGEKKVSVKVTVFECDAEMPEVEATYTNQGTTRYLSLKGKYKGVIETEFDIVNASPSTRQGVFYLLDKDAPGAWWNNAAALEFDTSTGCYQAVGGNGKGGNDTVSNAENSKYPANKDAENAVAYDGTGIYHVRIRIDTTDVDSTVAEGAAAVNKNAAFQIWMTDKDGKTTELTKGVTATSRHIISGIISQYFVGTYKAAENGDFKVINHKLSWQSGYVAKKIETYVDDVRIADLSSSSKLLPYSLMTEAERAAYTYEPDANIMQGEEKCVLQTEESGWFDGQGNKIANDAVAEKAVADAVLTYKAYYKKGVADFAGLRAKIREAQGLYDEQALIYTATSLKYLDDAIKAARDVADNSESSVEAVENAITALQAVLDKTDVTLVPKDYAAMNEALTAYYPMNEESKAGDTVGEYDGTVNGNITFTADGGAKLPGSSTALTNYISLPDTLPITDKMTFSFWVYCDNNADTETNATQKMHNTFCIGSGKKIGNNQGTATAHHVSIYAGQNGENLVVNGGPDGWGNGLKNVTVSDYEKQKWSLVTCVIDGKNVVVYQDGVKKDDGELGVSLTEAWNASPTERYILLGNNCYAYNGDWDYKGNIKNFRIYNVALAAQQVKDIFDNEVEELLDASAEKLAAGTMKAQAGTGENAGKYTLVITESKIKLPKKGSQGEAISWKAYSADGTSESAAVINPETGAVIVPEAGAAGVTAVLKATITISGVKREVTIICDVKNPINKESTEALKNEASAAMEGKNKADYDAKVWDELEAAIRAYEALPENAAPEKIVEAYNRLKAALDAFVPKKEDPVVAVTSVTLDKKTLELTVGQSETLKATVNPQNADQGVTWQSSKTDVATVVNGKVTANKAGTAVITVTSTADKSKTATCTVNVKAKTTSVAVKSVSLNVKKLTMGVKESYTLKATVNPGNASNKKVTWKSDKPKIVSVKNGKITAKKTGKAKITVTSSANKNAKKTITITVKKAPDKKAKVTLNKKSVKLKVKKTFQIKPKVSSKYGSATFKYTIDKKGKKAVKVDKNGKVTAKKKGTATITVKTYNGKGKSAKLKVTVK